MASEPDLNPPVDLDPVSAPVEAVAEAQAPVAAPPPSAPIDTLVTATLAARDNNETTRLMDGANREWFVGTANVDNRSNVLIQVRRGEAIREAYLSTATFTPDAALAAITDLDGALQ